MPLSPQTQAALDQLHAINFVITGNMTPEEARATLRNFIQAMPHEPEPIANIENRHIPGPAGDIPVRIYTPQGSGPFPILVYFHGGGWVVGDLDTEDDTCRALANQGGCLVVSVDYRLAPEHKFPAAPEDSYAATQWVATHASEINGDPSRIALAGTSAGGNLTAVVAQMARDRGGPRLVLQLMLVPGTDFRMQTASIEENANGYLLTKADMIWFTNHYLNDEAEKLNPLASPLLASDLSGLPPALIFTAEYDPLRDEGEQYGELLRKAGVPVTISRRNGAIHAFMVPEQMLPVLDEAAAALRAAFA